MTIKFIFYLTIDNTIRIKKTYDVALQEALLFNKEKSSSQPLCDEEMSNKLDAVSNKGKTMSS